MKKKVTIEWDNERVGYCVEPEKPEDGAPTLSEIYGVMEQVKFWMFEKKKTYESK